MKSDMKASNLKNILLITVIVLSAGLVIGFYFTQDWLKQLTIETNKIIYSPDVTVIDNDNSAPVEQSEVKSLTAKTMSLIAPSQNYRIMIDNDLKKYAAESGVTINGIAENTDITNKYEPLTLHGGIKTKKIAITVGSPVDFASLMRFIKAIETNTPKIQIASLSISKVRANNDSVTVEPIIIEIYVR